MKRHCVHCDIDADAKHCPRCGIVMVYQPTKDEIRASCAAIQAGWTSTERAKRGEQVMPAEIKKCRVIP